MKKLMLFSLLFLLFLEAKSQDTTCTYFKGKMVYEFDYKMDTILSKLEQETKYHHIEVKYGDVLCLDLSDTKKRYRNIITTYFDGTTKKEILKSNDHVYYSPRGTTKVSVGRATIFKI